MNERLTNLFKSIIIKEDLIDTGALLKSVRVFVKVDYDVVIINITSKYYVKYLKDKYRLIDQFLIDPILTDELELIYTPIYETYLQNKINNIPGLREINPRITLLINGR